MYPEAFDSRIQNQIIALAVEELRAWHHPVSPGRVNVHLQMQDLLHAPRAQAIRLSSAGQTSDAPSVDEQPAEALSPRATAPDPGAQWHAARSEQPLQVDESGPENVVGMRLVEDLQTGDLWRLAILRVETTGHGYQETLFVGLGDEPFGDDGGWKDPQQQRRFEDFVAKVRMLQPETQSPVAARAVESDAPRLTPALWLLLSERTAGKVPRPGNLNHPDPLRPRPGQGGAAAAVKTKGVGGKDPD